MTNNEFSKITTRTCCHVTHENCSISRCPLCSRFLATGGDSAASRRAGLSVRILLIDYATAPQLEVSGTACSAFVVMCEVWARRVLLERHTCLTFLWSSQADGLASFCLRGIVRELSYNSLKSSCHIYRQNTGVGQQRAGSLNQCCREL
jgi:hypothetical protein